MQHGRHSLIPAVLCCILSGAAGQAQSLPEGKGKAQFMRVCGDCHGVGIVVKTTNTADGWAAVVDDMVSRGAQGTQDDFDLVTRYLAAHFGPKVKINKAGEKELSDALGITSADARAIVHYREAAGGFKDWSDLGKVPNIDMKKLDDEKNRIDFSSSQAPTGDNNPGDKK